MVEVKGNTNPRYELDEAARQLPTASRLDLGRRTRDKYAIAWLSAFYAISEPRVSHAYGSYTRKVHESGLGEHYRSLKATKDVTTCMQRWHVTLALCFPPPCLIRLDHHSFLLATHRCPLELSRARTGRGHEPENAHVTVRLVTVSHGQYSKATLCRASQTLKPAETLNPH